MRTYIAWALAWIFAFGLVGCTQQEQLQQDETGLESFSYAEESAGYAEGEPGVKTTGFANASETEITIENAAEHAKNECTVEYDSVATWFDPDECVWKVQFYTSGMSGGDQTVYLDDTGKTLLIVYGE